MKAAKTDSRPDFPLMKQSDIVSFFHLQMPRWLFSHEKYKSLSLEAKVAYTFLLNRFQLSRLNGWVNDNGEVFVIFTRESLAGEMQISYKKAIASFQSLVSANLIWEKRVGRGNANQIYLALVDMPASDAAKHTAAPFGNEGARPANSAYLAGKRTVTRPVKTAGQDLPPQPVKTSQNGTSAPTEMAYPELPILHPSKKETRKTSTSENEKVSQPVAAQADDADSQDLDSLLQRCELWVLPKDAQEVFQNAIERLFYSASFTIGKATLPQIRVRQQLLHIDGIVLQDAYQKLRANTDRKVKNSTAYVMATLFNAIHESKSDLLVDPFLNSIACGPLPDRGRRNPACY